MFSIKHASSSIKTDMVLPRQLRNRPWLWLEPRISVVLVDLELQDDALALIRNFDEANPDLPIIAVGAGVNEAIPLTTRTLGVVEVLPKHL